MKDYGFDFTDCDFINSEMKFYSFHDFVYSCIGIKRLYENKLSKYGKIFYKWYVYANININMNQKNIIWSYLNNDIEKEKLYGMIKKD